MGGMQRWEGRVALVTGASSGIGRAVATMLAHQGLKVAICGRRMQRLMQLKAELEEEDCEVFAVQMDLREESRIVHELFEAVRTQWGGVDILVNSAGLGHKAPLMSGETELWREMLEVNVLSLCICTREAIRDMRGRGGEGHILHISSMAGHRVPPGSGVYAATKHAVRALTEALRQELLELSLPIRVTSISPGLVETDFARRYHRSEKTARKVYGNYKVLEAEDVATAVCYALACPEHMQIHDILLRPREQET